MGRDYSSSEPDKLEDDKKKSKKSKKSKKKKKKKRKHGSRSVENNPDHVKSKKKKSKSSKEKKEKKEKKSKRKRKRDKDLEACMRKKPKLEDNRKSSKVLDRFDPDRNLSSANSAARDDSASPMKAKVKKKKRKHKSKSLSRSRSRKHRFQTPPSGTRCSSASKVKKKRWNFSISKSRSRSRIRRNSQLRSPINSSDRDFSVARISSKKKKRRDKDYSRSHSTGRRTRRGDSERGRNRSKREKRRRKRVSSESDRSYNRKTRNRSRDARSRRGSKDRRIKREVKKEPRYKREASKDARSKRSSLRVSGERRSRSETREQKVKSTTSSGDKRTERKSKADVKSEATTSTLEFSTSPVPAPPSSLSTPTSLLSKSKKASPSSSAKAKKVTPTSISFKLRPKDLKSKAAVKEKNNVSKTDSDKGVSGIITSKTLESQEKDKLDKVEAEELLLEEGRDVEQKPKLVASDIMSRLEKWRNRFKVEKKEPDKPAETLKSYKSHQDHTSSKKPVEDSMDMDSSSSGEEESPKKSLKKEPASTPATTPVKQQPPQDETHHHLTVPQQPVIVYQQQMPHPPPMLTQFHRQPFMPHFRPFGVVNTFQPTLAPNQTIFYPQQPQHAQPQHVLQVQHPNMRIPLPPPVQPPPPKWTLPHPPAHNNHLTPQQQRVPRPNSMPPPPNSMMSTQPLPHQQAHNIPKGIPLQQPPPPPHNNIMPYPHSQNIEPPRLPPGIQQSSGAQLPPPGYFDPNNALNRPVAHQMQKTQSLAPLQGVHRGSMQQNVVPLKPPIATENAAMQNPNFAAFPPKPQTVEAMSHHMNFPLPQKPMRPPIQITRHNESASIVEEQVPLPLSPFKQKPAQAQSSAPLVESEAIYESQTVSHHPPSESAPQHKSAEVPVVMEETQPIQSEKAEVVSQDLSAQATETQDAPPNLQISEKNPIKPKLLRKPPISPALNALVPESPAQPIKLVGQQSQEATGQDAAEDGVANGVVCPEPNWNTASLYVNSLNSNTQEGMQTGAAGLPQEDISKNVGGASTEVSMQALNQELCTPQETSKDAVCDEREHAMSTVPIGSPSKQLEGQVIVNSCDSTAQVPTTRSETTPLEPILPVTQEETPAEPVPTQTSASSGTLTLKPVVMPGLVTQQETSAAALPIPREHDLNKSQNVSQVHDSSVQPSSGEAKVSHIEPARLALENNNHKLSVVDDSASNEHHLDLPSAQTNNPIETTFESNMARNIPQRNQFEAQTAVQSSPNKLPLSNQLESHTSPEKFPQLKQFNAISSNSFPQLKQFDTGSFVSSNNAPLKNQDHELQQWQTPNEHGWVSSQEKNDRGWVSSKVDHNKTQSEKWPFSSQNHSSRGNQFAPPYPKQNPPVVNDKTLANARVPISQQRSNEPIPKAEKSYEQKSMFTRKTMLEGEDDWARYEEVNFETDDNWSDSRYDNFFIPPSMSHGKNLRLHNDKNRKSLFLPRKEEIKGHDEFDVEMEILAKWKDNSSDPKIKLPNRFKSEEALIIKASVEEKKKEALIIKAPVEEKKQFKRSIFLPKVKEGKKEIDFTEGDIDLGVDGEESKIILPERFRNKDIIIEKPRFIAMKRGSFFLPGNQEFKSENGLESEMESSDPWGRVERKHPASFHEQVTERWGRGAQRPRSARSLNSHDSPRKQPSNIVEKSSDNQRNNYVSMFLKKPLLSPKSLAEELDPDNDKAREGKSTKNADCLSEEKQESEVEGKGAQLKRSLYDKPEDEISPLERLARTMQEGPLERLARTVKEGILQYSDVVDVVKDPYKNSSLGKKMRQQYETDKQTYSSRDYTNNEYRSSFLRSSTLPSAYGAPESYVGKVALATVNENKLNDRGKDGEDTKNNLAAQRGKPPEGEASECEQARRKMEDSQQQRKLEKLQRQREIDEKRKREEEERVLLQMEEQQRLEREAKERELAIQLELLEQQRLEQERKERELLAQRNREKREQLEREARERKLAAQRELEKQQRLEREARECELAAQKHKYELQRLALEARKREKKQRLKEARERKLEAQRLREEQLAREREARERELKKPPVLGALDVVLSKTDEYIQSLEKLDLQEERRIKERDTITIHSGSSPSSNVEPYQEYNESGFADVTIRAPPRPGANPPPPLPPQLEQRTTPSVPKHRLPPIQRSVKRSKHSRPSRRSNRQPRSAVILEERPLGRTASQPYVYNLTVGDGSHTSVISSIWGQTTLEDPRAVKNKLRRFKTDKYRWFTEKEKRERSQRYNSDRDKDDSRKRNKSEHRKAVKKSKHQDEKVEECITELIESFLHEYPNLSDDIRTTIRTKATAKVMKAFKQKKDHPSYGIDDFISDSTRKRIDDLVGKYVTKLTIR